jgi:hypothetical protein
LAGSGARTAGAGPRTCVHRNGQLLDLSSLAPTLADLFDLDAVSQRVQHCNAAPLCTLADALERGRLLAPCDLQALKAAGVTFACSLIERVIEERAQGDAAAAAAVRDELTAVLGGSLRNIRPGSATADAARRVLVARGLWSQYLEVGIGTDAEVFTKAQPMSAVGCGAEIGLHPRSAWNNTEPEIVLAVSSGGSIVGATLGNDLTLRDFEGRSALCCRRPRTTTRRVRSAVRAPVRRHVFARRRALRGSTPVRRGARRVRRARHQLAGREQSRRRPTSCGQRSATSPVSRRAHAVSRHDVRAAERSRSHRDGGSRTCPVIGSASRHRVSAPCTTS